MRFRVDRLRMRKGVAMIEYALIAALIGLVVVASVTNVGQRIRDIFTDLTTELTPEN